MFSCYLILILLLRFEPIHYCSPYPLWSRGFCRYKRCLRLYEWVCTSQVCRVVFIVSSSLTAYSFAKAQLFRLKLFHARHFPQAVFHPLLFSSSLPFCFKMQPKISAVSENEVREWYRCIIAEQENFGDGTIFGNLECSDLKSGGWAVTWRSVNQVLTLPKMSGLHGGHGLVGLAPAWESQLILRCFFWDVQESLSLSWKDFVQKSLNPAQTQFDAGLIVKQSVGDHYTCAPFFLFSAVLNNKLLSPQVKFKQSWEWEGKWLSEIPSKAFRLGVVSVRGEWRCKSWGNQSTFVLMLPRAACVW